MNEQYSRVYLLILSIFENSDIRQCLLIILLKLSKDEKEITIRIAGYVGS